MKATFHEQIEDIPAEAWNALVPDDNPFLDHRFLAGLERHGCIDARHGWLPHHLAIHDGSRLVAAAPLYLKGNSHGEFVFDWSWAHAYAEHGLPYYPKLLCGVPYSPVAGPRLLAGNDANAGRLRGMLIEAIRSHVSELGLSSAHANFTSEADAEAFAAAGWLARFDWQFHWHDRGWGTFDGFLASLSSRKRKNIRQERARVAREGVECRVLHGDDLADADWAALHAFYLATFEERGNHPVLTLDFFRHLGRAMPRNVVAVLCRRGSDIIAGALMLRSASTLYGRYWGCREQVDGLHFEACYYQGIEYCLREGLASFEPGAQGEHKLARGFLPTRTHSFHWIADARFRDAIAQSLRREGRALDDYRDELLRHSPYARTDRDGCAGDNEA